jgi:pyruvate kinase
MFNPTQSPPKIGVRSFKRTKILATIGPASDSPETIAAMMDAGVNCFRLNMAHGDYRERERQVKWIRAASRTLNKPVAILFDIQGPKIRFGTLPDKYEVDKGDRLQLGYETDPSSGILPVQYNLADKVEKGQRLLFNDGSVSTIVTAVTKEVIQVKVTRGGWFASQKGINLPDTDLKGDILTPKDYKDIRFALEQDADYIGLSFVQTPDDVEHLRQYLRSLKSDAKIISKIETRLAMDNIDSIVMVSDAVCIARGDLAVETSAEAIPVYQRHIIELCRRYGKISIVATQMLTSMIESLEPTRAEVSDVATATILGADCVWLSDETTVGRYPVETVAYMQRITRYAEEHLPIQHLFSPTDDASIQSAISSGVITLAHEVGALAIVAETKTGTTATTIARHRPQIPIIAVTSDLRTAQQLTLCYGVKAFVRPDSDQAGSKLTDWLFKHKILRKNDMVVIAAGKYPGIPGGTDTIKVRKVG